MSADGQETSNEPTSGEPRRSIFAFYHDPPIWIETSPVSLEQNPPTVNFDAFNTEVARRTIAGGVQVRVSVEGFFVFDFQAWPPGHRLEWVDGTRPPSFEAMADAAVNRTYVMNAFNVFFYSRLIEAAHATTDRMVVTPELLISSESLDTEDGQSFGNTRVSHLAMSRYVSTYNPVRPYGFDDRIHHRFPVVPKAVVESAIDDLSDLMGRGEKEDIYLLDLFLRASKAYQDHNHSLSVITYWAVIERLVNVLWQQMQADNKTRDGQAFIEGARKKRLEDGRTFSASVMTEILSLMSYLPLDVYNDLAAVRKVRNNWMHSLAPVTAQDAEKANSVCEKLLKQVKGYVVNGASGRRIHG
ncbi:hypothetical protein ACIRG5_41330 [Lentzea sp. NPDC102401]|uniref:hypothetical protein n=1 Tax=Lentzea sp. NPDC102401 TaxID=3364128 RepID=UPI0037F1F3D3